MATSSVVVELHIKDSGDEGVDVLGADGLGVQINDGRGLMAQ